MEPCRILIISGHPLFAEGLTRLLASPVGREAVEVVAAVAGWEQARDLIARHRPQAVIVEYEGGQSPLPEPAVEVEMPRVIYVTLAANEMVVHERRRVAPVTVADLLDALHSSGPPPEGRDAKTKKTGRTRRTSQRRKPKCRGSKD